MRRGRTVEIKTFSATAWTGSMTTLHFVSQPANCSTLLWPQLQRSCPRSSWRFGGQTVSSCQQNAVALLERRWQVDNHRQGIPVLLRLKTHGVENRHRFSTLTCVFSLMYVNISRFSRLCWFTFTSQNCHNNIRDFTNKITIVYSISAVR